MSKSDSELLKRRGFVINEVVKTELSYNNGLQMIYELCTKKLNKAIQDKTFSVSEPRIIQGFESLYDVQKGSQEFIGRLHVTVLKNEGSYNIADTFENFTDLTRTYFQYIYLYHEFSPLLKSERFNNKPFNSFLTDIEKKINDTIEAILITPIQRPPRYRLLIQEIIKNTPTSYVEYPRLQAALAEICNAIDNVDKKIDAFDEAISMAAFQEKITDFDVIGKSGRRLFWQGNAVKFSRSYTNQRYVVLFSDTLLVCESNLVVFWKVNKLYPSGEYLIVNVQDNPPFINAIDIRQKDKSFRCNLDTIEAKRNLLTGFERMMQFNNLTLAQLEVRGFAPVWIPDDQAPNCMECQVKFSFFTRRHHCRWCGKCVCSQCWKNKIKLPGLSDSPQHVCTECFSHILSMEREHVEASLVPNPENPFSSISEKPA